VRNVAPEALRAAVHSQPEDRYGDEENYMIEMSGAHHRVVYCECGTGLSGGSDIELFEAVQQHIEIAHPQLLLGREWTGCCRGHASAGTPAAS
jgi:hypothetical protein